MATISLENLPVKSKQLYQPTLDELAIILNAGLKNHFAKVEVSVVECPDLTKEPFTLANKGLHGKASIIEVGGPSFLLPLVQKDKIYDMKDVATISKCNPAFIIGAGAGPFPSENTNCEGIYNLNIDNGVINQQSRISKIDLNNKAVPIEKILTEKETRFALLANLFVSEGKAGKVLKIHTKKRIGKDSFVDSIQEILKNHYSVDKLVGLGGVFIVKEGKIKQHVMPDFSTKPINSDQEVEDWLHFFNMSAPLIAVGTLVSQETDLDLRVKHFHSFSYHNEGGHYHIDTTPDIVEYLGYFNVGETLYRVDQPINGHSFGRD